MSEADGGDDLTVRVPDGFLWGAATAAHQTEGNNLNSSHWVAEYAPGTAVPEPSGDACDSFHRYAEDIALVAGAGLGAYRFSIEWARVEPEPGVFSRAALAHYRRMIDECLERGIEPVVTLHHFTFPRWWQQRGGWRAADAVGRFTAYVEVVARILADVKWVVTINEPNMLVIQLGAVTDTTLGVNATGVDEQRAEKIAAAHRAATEVVRSSTKARVGWSVANQVFQAVPGWEEQRDAWRYWREDFFLEQSRADDFVGVQAYLRTIIGPAAGPLGYGPQPWPDGTRFTLTGWEYYPAALGEAIRHTSAVAAGVPILVTENGIATADDDERIAYTREALAGLAAALADGCDVRGYLHWSLLDNYEWGSYRPTFGLVCVDRDTFLRHPKPSLAWLGALAQRAGARDQHY
jgi:beta-glucosidase/6-phospho-beta-glucosidase/beta-galactosidase